jgi:hypothetical protein
MSLTCPRCETEVPSEGLYCPYCSLPKPRSGFAGATEASPEEDKPTEQQKPPVGFKSSNKERKGSPSRPVSSSRPASSSRPVLSSRPVSSSRPVKTPRTTTARKLRLPIGAALVAILSVGIYIFVVPLLYSEHAEPKVVLSALETLRRLPSNEAGLTIDARLTRELETAKRVKNLVSYKGWTVQPIKGTRTKVLMIYSYQEVGDVTKRAEWLADLTTNTFIPQTDMAAAIHGKQ